MQRQFYSIAFTISTLTLCLFTACKKEQTYTAPTLNPPKITFVNAIPSLSNLDFYIGAAKTASITNGFSCPYLQVEPGKKEISVSNASENGKVANMSVDLQNGSNYAVFLCGTPSKAELLSVEYNQNLPNADKVKVRFINLSQSPGGLSLSIRGLQPSYTDQPYKRITAFEIMDPRNEVSYDIRKQNDQTVSASLEKTKLEAGKIYTLIAYDEKSKADEAIIKLNIMQNN
ncbi:DUF4397 domain-containing protein [Pedobacter sp.]|uniref:DUF4397 domain-containing protein n=1 Tax=Pedobacter sp. TaxID=1411316 RepID=UPI003C507EBE